MKTREQIIKSMMMTYRHDCFRIRREDDPPWVAGMTENERKGLWLTMAQIYDTNIAPFVKIKIKND